MLFGEWKLINIVEGMEINKHCWGNAYTFGGDNCVKIVLSPSESGIYSIRKEFAPRGS